MQKLTELYAALSLELNQHILPYWIEHSPDDENGGFVGAIDNKGKVIPSEKSGILNTRILWTFSATARLLNDAASRKLADRAVDYILDKFMDPDNGGIYWSLNPDGTVCDNRKHIYTQAFAIYGLAEYYLTSNDNCALEQALSLFRLVDEHARQNDASGYHEAFHRNWSAMDDARLSGNDIAAERTFNTHLHLLEAYTNLYRISSDDDVADRLRELVLLHIDRMYDPEWHHIPAYFDRKLKPVSPVYSYGHDIEAVWLLYDAVVELHDAGLMEKCRLVITELADQICREGTDNINGGIYNTGQYGKPSDTGKQWWAQAEALSGLYYAWAISGTSGYIDAAKSIWDFINSHVIDHKHGEWHFLVDSTGTPVPDYTKVGPWKCPYHNTRTGLLYTAASLGLHERTPFSILNQKDIKPESTASNQII